MAGKKSDLARERETNEKFEKQLRRLNRKRMRHVASGILVLALIIVALRFTRYRTLPMDIFKAAKKLVSNFTSGPAAPSEPDVVNW